MPNLFVIAGPNGAGKSTSASELLSGLRRVAEFVNADVIQKERGVSEMEAGRIALERLTELAEQKRAMAFETTLASHLLLPRIRAMQAEGYRFHLFFFFFFFFWLPSADMAVRRVAARVVSGGHHIPEDVVRRRYERGLENLFNRHMPVADTWVLMNNTLWQATPIATRGLDGCLWVEDNVAWKELSGRYMKPGVEEEKAHPYVEQEWTVEDITDAVNRAVTAALKRHKERGESVVVWREGEIVTLGPEEIEV